MRARILAVVGAAVLMLAGCDAAGDTNANEKEDCTGPIVDPKVWAEKCVPSLAPTFTMPFAETPSTSPTPTATATSTPPKPPADVEIGKPVTTVGDAEPPGGIPGGGPVELTVTAVVYRQTVGLNMVVIGIKQRPGGDVPAAKQDYYGMSWRYIAPDGKVQEGSSAATAMGWTGGDDAMQPGQYTLDTQSFLIDPAQKGGTVEFKDGAGQVFRWKLPAQDGGPQVAELRKGLDPFSG